jgi:fused signal recognition particle receptor
MFKFWKKKPAESAPKTAAEETAETAQAEARDAAMHEREAPSAPDQAASAIEDGTATTAPMPVDPALSAWQAPAVLQQPETEPFSGRLETVLPAPGEAAAEASAEVSIEASGETPSEPAASESPAPTREASATARPSWRERLAGSALARGFSSLFSRNPKLDEALLEDIETCLLSADVGVAATEALVQGLRKRMDRREFADARALVSTLRADLRALLTPVAQPLRIEGAKPFVILTVGINGVGKTTSIGKLAHRFRGEGVNLLLAAGDTFRAAAVEQLKTWGDRIGVPVVSQGQGADSASVIYDALSAAQSRGVDLLIADTAGRLHTQGGLMDELAKVRRVLGKLDPSAPHEVLMVIDGTTGQNAVNQVRQFRASAGVTGLVVTKLDGTAKGGVVFALAREFGLPIRFVGLGEKAADLRVFDPEAFVDALLPETLGA